MQSGINIQFTTKDISELGRLRRCLNSGVIQIDGLKSFLERMQERVDQQSAPTAKLRESLKPGRKEKYRAKLRIVV